MAGAVGSHELNTQMFFTQVRYDNRLLNEIRQEPLIVGPKNSVASAQMVIQTRDQGYAILGSYILDGIKVITISVSISN